jgi:hypothetical protein
MQLALWAHALGDLGAVKIASILSGGKMSDQFRAKSA